MSDPPTFARKMQRVCQSSEQIKPPIQYFISFQYNPITSKAPLLFSLYIHALQELFLKKETPEKNLQYWTKPILNNLLLFFIPWNYSRSHWLKLLSSVKHFKSLESEARWSHVSVSE